MAADAADATFVAPPVAPPVPPAGLDAAYAVAVVRAATATLRRCHAAAEDAELDAWVAATETRLYRATAAPAAGEVEEEGEGESLPAAVAHVLAQLTERVARVAADVAAWRVRRVAPLAETYGRVWEARTLRLRQLAETGRADAPLKRTARFLRDGVDALHAPRRAYAVEALRGRHGASERSAALLRVVCAALLLLSQLPLLVRHQRLAHRVVHARDDVLNRLRERAAHPVITQIPSVDRASHRSVAHNQHPDPPPQKN